MSSRSNVISQNSLSILSRYLCELHLNLFKVMCGFGVRREILEVVSIYFSHSVTHAEWQDQIRSGFLLCFVMGIWDGLFCAVFSPSPWATFIKPGWGKFADNHLFVRKIFIWRNKFYVEISSHLGWCSSGNGRVSACP